MKTCISCSGESCVYASLSCSLSLFCSFLSLSITEKETGGSLAPWQQERVVTSPATMWLRLTPSKQKSTSSSCSTTTVCSTPQRAVSEHVVLYYDDMLMLLLRANTSVDDIVRHAILYSPKVSLPAPDALLQLLTDLVLRRPLWQVVFREDHSAWLRKDPSEPAEQTRNLLGEGERDY